MVTKPCGRRLCALPLVFLTHLHGTTGTTVWALDTFRNCLSAIAVKAIISVTKVDWIVRGQGLKDFTFTVPELAPEGDYTESWGRFASGQSKWKNFPRGWSTLS